MQHFRKAIKVSISSLKPERLPGWIVGLLILGEEFRGSYAQLVPPDATQILLFAYMLCTLFSNTQFETTSIFCLYPNNPIRQLTSY